MQHVIDIRPSPIAGPRKKAYGARGKLAKHSFSTSTLLNQRQVTETENSEKIKDTKDKTDKNGLGLLNKLQLVERTKGLKEWRPMLVGQ